MNIDKLKNKILQLAIEGKLVEQDKNDESAHILYEKIQEEKEKLIKEKKIRRVKVDGIEESEMPFDIPKNWKWVRLGDVVTINMKNNNLEDDTKASFIPMTLISDGYKNEHSDEVKPWMNIKKGYTHFKEGDVLLSKITPCFENKKSTIASNLINGYGAGTTEVFALDIPEIDISNKYLLHFVKRDDFISEGIKNFTGTAGHKRISRTFLENIPFPLPPLNEQKRIVEKIDELFKIIDELNSEKEDILKLIQRTRDIVLTKAIQGKLVKQDKNDESAETLYEKIQEEKEKLIKEKKIRRVKVDDIDESERPFEIPKNWKWARLEAIAIINMGQSPKGEDVNELEGLEFHQGKTNFGDIYLNNSGKYTIDPKKIALKGDVIVSVRAPVGDLNITDRKICLGRGLAGIQSVAEIENLFYFYFMKSLRVELINKSTGTTFKAITAKVLQNLMIPLPPLNEQKRIVKKIDKIMNYLNEIEACTY